MKRTAIWTWIVVGVFIVLAGCESAPTVVPNPQVQALDSPEGDVEFSDILPATTGPDVLAYLEREDFRETWDLWPGKGREYPGGEPHGLLLTTYLNPLALEAVDGRDGTMPLGAMIVKDNYATDGTLVATTLMYRRDGDNSGPGGWFWMKWQPDRSIDAAGAVEACLDCHGTAADNDYLLTASLTP